MAKSLISALALAALPSTLAFRNTSPFFLFSTADLDIPGDDIEIAQASNVHDQIAQALEGCPSKTYFVVRQHGVSSTDFLDRRSTPRLAHYLSGKDADVKSTMVVPEVLESNETKDLSHYIQQKCGAGVSQAEGGKVVAAANGAGPRVIEVSFSAPSLSQRATTLGQYDSELETLIAKIANSQDYTVIYMSTPPTEEHAKAAFEDQRAYEMEDPFGGAVQMELKRDLSSHRRAEPKEGGLFEKYQFFTPGIFMGIGAILPMFSIVYVGLRALSSLEVSYFAFSKEMGPAAQRKQ